MVNLTQPGDAGEGSLHWVIILVSLFCEMTVGDCFNIYLFRITQTISGSTIPYEDGPRQKKKKQKLSSCK